jgi:hypothetical protein
MIEPRDIAEALGGRRTLNGWMCKCPAHEDDQPSLSVSAKPDGSPLIHCFAGCGFTDIVTALRDRGLWPAPTKKQKQLARRRYSLKAVEYAETVLYIASCDLKKGRTLSDADQETVKRAYQLLKGTGRV